MKPPLRILQIAGLNALLLVGLLSLIDIFIGDSGKSPARNIFLREHPPFTDRIVEPNDTYMLRTSSLDKKACNLRTDLNGFITGGPITTEQPEAVEIIFYGGSSTECLYVADSLRFPYLVQKKINLQRKHKIKVLNGGVSGNNSMHSTLNLIAKGLPLKPKIVVLLNNANDFALLSKTGSYWIGPHARGVVSQDQNESLFITKVRALKNLLIPNLYAFFADRTGSTDTDEWNDYRNKASFDVNLVELEFEKSLKRFIHLAKINNIEVVLMTQFNRINLEDQFIVGIQQDPEHFKLLTVMCKRLNNKIREIANSERTGLIDLESILSADEKYIYDEIHLNSRGCKYVSSIISEYLLNKYYRLNTRK